MRRVLLAWVVVFAWVGIVASRPGVKAEESSSPLPPNGSWTQLSPMPTARFGLASVELNGLVYAIGGAYANNQVFDVGRVGVAAVEAYDPISNTWAPMAPLPFPRVYPNGATAINGRIYLPGGAGCDAPGCAESSSLFIFDPTNGPSGSWSTGPSMPRRILGGMSGAIDNQLYVLAGRSIFVSRNNLYRYDPANPGWIELTGSPRGHTFGASAVWGGKLYAFGGESNQDALDIYDPATDSWTSKTMPIGFEHQAAVTVGDILYLVGGDQFENGVRIARNIVMAYDPQADAWSTPAPVPSAGGPYTGTSGAPLALSGGSTSPLSFLPAAALNFPGAASVGSALFVMGGGSLNNVQIFPTLYGVDPPTTEPLTFSWAFGDGDEGSGENPIHTYAVPGTYTVTLTVSTSDGRTGSATALVTIEGVADNEPPLVACEAASSAWSGGDVSLSCTASDTGAGLANAADASFTLTTAVPDGVESASALTDLRMVCDSAGNCAAAGPIGGNKVDRKAPVITVSTPAATSYTLGQIVNADYACTDGGSGLSGCAGSVPSGSPIDTSAPGSHSFVVNASDAAGNTAGLTRNYTVSYNVCVLFDQTKAHKSGSTAPIKLQVCTATGTNVSSSSIPLVATGVYLVSNNAPGSLEDSGSANPDLQFRFDTDKYVFNLSLKGFAEGTYALAFAVGSDPTPHTVTFQVK